MDARDYDRIGDLLMQIRKKIANEPTSHNPIGGNLANNTREDMLHHIDILLAQNDSLAKADGKGLI